jgi:hypothetical protein
MSQKMKALYSSEMSRTNHPVMQHHIPEQYNCQTHPLKTSRPAYYKNNWLNSGKSDTTMFQWMTREFF